MSRLPTPTPENVEQRVGFSVLEYRADKAKWVVVGHQFETRRSAELSKRDGQKVVRTKTIMDDVA